MWFNIVLIQVHTNLLLSLKVSHIKRPRNSADAASQTSRSKSSRHDQARFVASSGYKQPKSPAQVPTIETNLIRSALAADWITARKSVRGGCASSRLFHSRTDSGNPYVKGQKSCFSFLFLQFFDFFGGPGGLRGGCASSRLDHGSKTRAGRLR